MERRQSNETTATTRSSKSSTPVVSWLCVCIKSISKPCIPMIPRRTLIRPHSSALLLSLPFQPGGGNRRGPLLLYWATTPDLTVCDMASSQSVNTFSLVVRLCGRCNNGEHAHSDKSFLPLFSTCWWQILSCNSSWRTSRRYLDEKQLWRFASTLSCLNLSIHASLFKVMPPPRSHHEIIGNKCSDCLDYFVTIVDKTGFRATVSAPALCFLFHSTHHC